MATDDYPRIPLLEHAEWLADSAGLKKPEGLRWGLKAVHADLRAFGGFRWPCPGNWVEASAIDASNHGPCPSWWGDGLCIALSWAGMAAGGVAANALLLVGYAAADVLGSDYLHKLRVGSAFVRDVIDGDKLVREHGRNANLRGANLVGANLQDAYLDGADLSHAYLCGANLSHAKLLGANLCKTALDGANLRYAGFSGAKYDQWTTWPAGFEVPVAWLEEQS